MWSCDLIGHGLCWRIGNGKLVSIKHDMWIPGLTGFKILPNFGVDHLVEVDSLISKNGIWNDLVVRQLFLSHEAVAILDSSLNRRRCSDIRIWQKSF